MNPFNDLLFQEFLGDWSQRQIYRRETWRHNTYKILNSTMQENINALYRLGPKEANACTEMFLRGRGGWTLDASGTLVGRKLKESTEANINLDQLENILTAKKQKLQAEGSDDFLEMYRLTLLTFLVRVVRRQMEGLL